jgi:hypothetical protein
MRRRLFAIAGTIAAVSFSQIALSQIDIRGRGVQGDVNQSTTQQGDASQATTQQGTGSQSTTQQQGTDNQATTQQGTGNQATTQSGTTNQSTSQMGADSQSSTQQPGTRDQTAQQTQTPSGAGPTENPNVTLDKHGREHENKGKHKGWAKGHDRDEGQSARQERKDRSGG